VSDSAPAAAPGATGDPEMAKAIADNAALGLTIKRNLHTGYTIVRGQRTRFAKPGEIQAVIDREFS